MRLIIALLAASSIALGFGWLHTMWFPYEAAEARDVMLVYAAATLLVAGCFLAGQFIPVKGHAYYVIIAGVVFLAVDAIIWWRFGIMPGPKSYQDGFVPAAIMGLFLGPLYRIIAPAP